MSQFTFHRSFGIMGALCVWVGAMIGLFAGGCGQDATGGQGASAAAAGPKIVFDGLQHDFGVVSETESRSANLRFTNTGDETLVIKDITTTCGCTAATPDKQQYAPGESGEIRVVFNPSAPNEPGDPQRKYVNVVTNSVGEEESTRIIIIADVRAFVVLEPRMVEFGVVDLGASEFIDVFISSTDPEYTIERIRVTHRNLSGALLDETAPATIEARKSTPGARIVRVGVDPDAPWGNLFGWLEVVVTGRPSPGEDPITHTSRMRVQAQVFGELAGEPDTYRFGVKPNETFDRPVVLTHRHGELFEVRRASVQCTALKNADVTVRRISHDQIELNLHATAEAPAGGSASMSARGTVTIETSVSGRESTLEIPIVGVVRDTMKH